MTGGSRNWRLGFTLSLTTAAPWGPLPIALKVVLDGMDAVDAIRRVDTDRGDMPLKDVVIKSVRRVTK